MKILKIAGVTLLAVMTVYIVIIIVLPSKVFVERSIVVNARPEEVYNYLEDLRNFQEWAYWAEIDPLTAYEYKGALKGVGSRMDWHSEHVGMGYGSLWIVATIPPRQINLDIQLREFDKPAQMTFNFLEEGNGTRITWNFQTKFYGYWKFFVPMMEEELGPAYEKGLRKIKSVLDSQPS
ncbi:SRPBCC family protein [Fulvivirgaceae bacterium BMA12]|uniref:SRPBCC family protein n=1 Tax=Agaribacillus aureus TaxID=3051825 RepID=A0ABT8LDG2_9BACT|nr:SRPBCC family protein [Fulvivirgaceae bacterium BMA12]